MSSQPVGRARWFTTARKIPSMIGRLHDGSRIWGGPYTLTQGFSAVGTAIVLWKTRGLWGGDSSGLIEVGFILGAAAMVCFLTGFLPDDRNPLLWTAGVMTAVAQPRHGRLNGRRVALPPLQRLHGKPVVQTTEPLTCPVPTPMSAAAPAYESVATSWRAGQITTPTVASEQPRLTTAPQDSAVVPRQTPQVSPTPPAASPPSPATPATAGLAPSVALLATVRHSGVEALLAAARSQGARS